MNKYIIKHNTNEVIKKKLLELYTEFRYGINGINEYINTYM